MPFKKGKSGNPNGRTKGTPNKSTAATRESIALFVGGKMDEVEEIWQNLSHVQRAKFLTDLIPYVAPKLAAVEHSGEVATDAPSLIVTLGGKKVPFK